MTAADRDLSPPCAVAARAAREPLFGTAPEATENLLVLPQPGPWPATIPEEVAWPRALAPLADWARAEPSVRVQLSRAVGAAPPTDGPPRALLARTGGPTPQMASADPVALTPEACAAFFAGGPAAPPLRRESAPVVLVCVHGRRDACCARFGVRFAAALSRHGGVCVLGTSHLGGHRFAATAIVLPRGEIFGWLEPKDAPRLAAFARGDEGALADRYRGRIGRPAAVQVAIAWWLARAGRLLPDETVAVEQDGADRTIVRLSTGDGPVRLVVRSRPTSLVRPKSCGDPPSPVPARSVEPLP